MHRFLFAFRKPPRCIHHFNFDVFAPFSSFLFGGSHTELCFVSVSECHIYHPRSEFVISRAFFKQKYIYIDIFKRVDYLKATPRIEDSEPFTLGDSVGPSTDSAVISVDRESVRGSWDFNLGAKLLLFLPLVSLDSASREKSERSFAEDNRNAKYLETTIA